MWELISGDFSRVPSQAIVAKYMLDIGIRIDGTRLYVDRVAISYNQLAKAVGKDKQIVSATVKTINSNKKLYGIYSKLHPSCNLKDVAKEMGWDVLELALSDPAKPGVLGEIASTIGTTGISIRQAIGEDPTYSTGLLYIITETPLPGDLLKKIRAIDGVVKISLH
jgi:predicted regulator of amino acid metabolism with ACT domain